ncbi:hypothetical protein RAB80_014487 [Fusarium oxysporum f. sp. vasinfectum]|nr:hypothetical protein RAB80_014487 [Fusarium oxysporum f. sp. vasinfectum]
MVRDHDEPGRVVEETESSGLDSPVFYTDPNRVRRAIVEQARLWSTEGYPEGIRVGTERLSTEGAWCFAETERVELYLALARVVPKTEREVTGTGTTARDKRAWKRGDVSFTAVIIGVIPYARGVGRYGERDHDEPGRVVEETESSGLDSPVFYTDPNRVRRAIVEQARLWSTEGYPEGIRVGTERLSTEGAWCFAETERVELYLALARVVPKTEREVTGT